jgi:hypothetical protein
VEIKIACAAADLVNLDDLHELQGNLKTMDDVSLNKLKQSLIKWGFSFPVHAWKDKHGKIFIIDAHQRTRALKSLRDEGYEIPPLPVSWIEAKNKTEAAKKLMLSVSSFGQMIPDGLHQFIDNFKIDMSFLDNELRLPEIDMADFHAAYFPETKEVSFNAKTGSKELDESEFGTFAHTCPKCGFGFD